MVFSPYWNIPAGYRAQKEIVPRRPRTDPVYLERNNIEVDEGRRPLPSARPGKGNSLGLVKFVFPNHFNVYLHDTPAHALFDRVERDFRPRLRAARAPDGSREIRAARPAGMDRGEDRGSDARRVSRRSANLREPLPIYLVILHGLGRERRSRPWRISSGRDSPAWRSRRDHDDIRTTRHSSLSALLSAAGAATRRRWKYDTKTASFAHHAITARRPRIATRRSSSCRRRRSSSTRSAVRPATTR